MKLTAPDGKEIKKFFVIPDKFKNLISRDMETGGIITDKKNNIYFATITEPAVYVYNSDFQFVKKIYSKPYQFNNVERDLSLTGQGDMILDYLHITKDKSFLWGINDISEDLLMLKIFAAGKIKLWILNLADEKVINDEIIINERPLFAKNGLLYFARQPKIDAKGNMPNPRLLVYKLKESVISGKQKN